MAGGFDTGYSTGYDTAASSAGVAGWDGLLGILRTARQEFEENEARIPEACPLHGEPLDEVRGLLHCSVGHFVDRDGSIY